MDRSCVMRMSVCAYLRIELLSISIISREFLLSRFPVGSSASMSSGLCISARANATLCC